MSFCLDNQFFEGVVMAKADIYTAPPRKGGAPKKPFLMPSDELLETAVIGPIPHFCSERDIQLSGRKIRKHSGKK